MKYVELECVNEYFNEVKAYDVKEYLAIKPSGKTDKTRLYPKSIWDDEIKEVETYRLNDILDDIYAAGWEYKCTYWMGGSSSDAHKVFCFIHP